MSVTQPAVGAFGRPADFDTPVEGVALPKLPTIATGATRRRVPGTELDVFPIALFGSTFGWSVQSGATEGILDNYVEVGGNLLQTSDHHSAGASERMVGQWMKDRGIRDRMVLSSTVGRTALAPNATAAELIRSAEASLTRLGTDRIELLNLHGVRDDVSVHEGLAAAERLIRDGKVLHVVANDYSPERLLQSRIAAAHLDAPRFVAVAMTYNLAQRERFERDVATIASAQQLSLMPKHSLANGFLTGVYRERAQARRSDRALLALRFLDRRGRGILAALDKVTQATGEDHATVALAWLLAKPAVLAPMVSAGSPRQIRSIGRAVETVLTPEQLALLDAASA